MTTSYIIPDLDILDDDDDDYDTTIKDELDNNSEDDNEDDNEYEDEDEDEDEEKINLDLEVIDLNSNVNEITINNIPNVTDVVIGDNYDNYDKFYKEDITNINLKIIYINKENKVIKEKNNFITLTESNFLLREEIIGIIKNNNILDNIKYSLFSLLVYIINIDPQFITSFLKSKDPNIGDPFLRSITNIDTIKLEKSIPIFKDVNEIIFIFHQDQIKYTDYKNNLHNTTKKIIINSRPISSKKTKRNYI
jgi:hypothetical protein